MLREICGDGEYVRYRFGTLGVIKVMERYGWCWGETWSGTMRVYAVVCIVRIMPPKQRLVCLLYSL